jgi:hypothetical protein
MGAMSSRAMAVLAVVFEDWEDVFVEGNDRAVSGGDSIPNVVTASRVEPEARIRVIVRS